MKKYWLMKSEPSVYSVEDFKRDHKTLWEGVRNYQARNFMTNDMSLGDEFLFYHSSCDIPAVVGRGTVSAKAQPDPSAFDKKSEYFEPKATREKPIWLCVEVRFAEIFDNPVSLEQIRREPKLSKMVLLKKGSRLSIQPVAHDEFKIICDIGHK